MKPLRAEERLAPEWVRAWRTDPASPQEVRRAYARFRARREARSLAPAAGRWLVAGLLMGLGIAYGATGAPLAALRSLVPGLASHAEPSPEAAKRAAHGDSAAPAAAATAVEATSQSVRATAPPSEAFAIEPANPTASTRSARAPVRSSNGAAANAPSEMPSASAEMAASRADDAWQRAARGLREHDLASANTALVELEASPRAADRDAARLTRAQMLLAAGQHDAARRLLGDLAQNAASSRVRDKAQHLLADSQKSPVSDRSGFDVPDTN